MSANQLEEIGMDDCVVRVEQTEGDYDFIRNIDTSKTICYALKAIQELTETVDTQSIQIKELTKRIENI